MIVVFIFKQKTAYEIRISDWSSDVCSSDLSARRLPSMRHGGGAVFVDQRAAAEAVEAEGGVQRMRFVMRDGMGENMAAAGSRLEASGAPAAIDIEIGIASCRERVCQYV